MTDDQCHDSKYFWKPEKGNKSIIRPDIVLNKDKDNCIVLDTKWKNLGGGNPSPADLRQMFVYMKYYNAKKVALIYPSSTTTIQAGQYFQVNGELGNEECSLVSIGVNQNITEWQKMIAEQLSDWSFRCSALSQGNKNGLN